MNNSKEIKQGNFTEGPIAKQLISFAFPVLIALFLQSLYGAVDLLVVGQFAQSLDVSAVSTGSQIMMTLTHLITSFSMGTTLLLGQKIGEGRGDEGGRIIGASIFLFTVIGLIMSAAAVIFSPALAGLMNAPAEAYAATVSYIRICGGGLIVIIFYNLIGSIFRGLGDSKTPLISVAIAAVFNILGDLLFVCVFGLGAAGAAIATVCSQLLSVVFSVVLIRRKTLPFSFSKEMIRPDGLISKKLASLGIPLALSNFLVSISFLIILSIVNALGLMVSAGVGVAEKLCGFIMLVPMSFSQAMAAFVAQNTGARKFDRAEKALKYGIALSFAAGVLMAYLSFFHGDILASIFDNDAEVAAIAWEYLKAYAIDCLFTAFLFCFIGFFNGVGMTRFNMIQDTLGAFCVRIPVSFFMSRQVPVSVFHVGLATPCSSFVQIVLCVIVFISWKRKHVSKV